MATYPLLGPGPSAAAAAAYFRLGKKEIFLGSLLLFFLPFPLPPALFSRYSEQAPVAADHCHAMRCNG